MSSIPSATGDLFSMTGLNAYWNYTLVRDPIAEGVHTATQFIDDANSYSPNMFANAGAGIGSTAASIGMSSAVGWQTYNQWKNYKSGLGSFKDVYKHSGGILGQDSVFSIRKDNTIRTLKGNTGFREKFAYPQEFIDDLKSSNTKGYLKRSGKFISHKGWKLPLAATVAAVGASVALPWLFSKAGQVLDSAGQASLNRRKHYYNSSYYSTEQYEQSAYQQIGASMQALENKMVSTGRLYHHRG